MPVPFKWGYFPGNGADVSSRTRQRDRQPTETFPESSAIATRRAPAIIEEFGEEHIRTGKPICYTSADSVIQIAAHETHFGLERLYALCKASASWSIR